MAEVYLEDASAGIELWPPVLRVGERIQIAFRAARIVGALREPRYEVSVFDTRNRRVATLLRGAAKPSGGVVFVEWEGRDDRGLEVPSGAFQLRVQGLGSALRLERTIIVER
jgi:hypothetical protein